MHELGVAGGLVVETGMFGGTVWNEKLVSWVDRCAERGEGGEQSRGQEGLGAVLLLVREIVFHVRVVVASLRCFMVSHLGESAHD